MADHDDDLTFPGNRRKVQFLIINSNRWEVQINGSYKHKTHFWDATITMMQHLVCKISSPGGNFEENVCIMASGQISCH